MASLDPEVLDALRKISSPTIANAIETFGVRPRNAGFVAAEIVCRFPRLGVMLGHAVTALIRAEPPPLEGHRAAEFAWWDHVAQSPGPRVVVMHDIDEPRGVGAYWGEVQANIHKALGCAGVVTDGTVRDLPEAEALGFHFFSAHVSVSHAYVHMVDFGLPVKVGGLVVRPGDLLHGDQHGVVVIPPEIAARIPEAATRIEARERTMIAVCQKPGVTLDQLKAARKAMQQAY
ncbi:MAG TPA: RraA family protein [Methylomirabilota bacterium]|jgi:regulator of RNase E activity RraA|nr:RraA family protein [Methylomirabilota bacterium]